MPGVHYKAVQSRVPMARVLEWVGFVAQRVTGDQLRGPCPVHRSQSLRSRSFSVHLARDVCHCFKCGFAGNQIQLWAALQQNDRLRGGRGLMPAGGRRGAVDRAMVET